VTLEEPDLFNRVVGDFLSRVDGGVGFPAIPVPARPGRRLRSAVRALHQRRTVKFAEI
jgi:hypothetical protein